MKHVGILLLVLLTGCDGGPVVELERIASESAPIVVAPAVHQTDKTTEPLPSCLTCSDAMSGKGGGLCPGAQAPATDVIKCLATWCGDGVCDQYNNFFDTAGGCLDCAADNCGDVLNVCAEDR